MTDKELKSNIRKIGIIAIFIFLLIIFLTFYILGVKKADLSVCSSESCENDLRALGIEETEFKEYLSIFSNLINSEENDNIKKLDTATEFIDKMIAITQENIDNKTYESQMINQVVQELNGGYIEKNIQLGDKYYYDSENKVYIKNNENEEVPICKEIKKIYQNGEKIEIEYTAEQNGVVKNIKAIIMKNTDYEYSKYFLISISELE